MPTTIRAHLYTVRARYRRLLRDNDLRDALEIAIREDLEAQGNPTGPPTSRRWYAASWTA